MSLYPLLTKFQLYKESTHTPNLKTKRESLVRPDKMDVKSVRTKRKEMRHRRNFPLLQQQVLLDNAHLIIKLFDRPSTKLFRDFLENLIQRYQVQHRVVKGKVSKVELCCDYVTFSPPGIV